MQELCRRLPTFEYHNGVLLLAVGVPPTAHAGAGSSGAASAMAANTAVLANAPQPPDRSALLYDMHTGLWHYL